MSEKYQTLVIAVIPGLNSLMVFYPCDVCLADPGRNLQDGVHVQRSGKQTSGHYSPHETASEGLAADSDCPHHQRVRVTGDGLSIFLGLALKLLSLSFV